MAYKCMGSGSREYPPYSKTFAAGANPGDITDEIEQARCSASSLHCIAIATTVQLTWKDAGGNVNDTGSITNMVAGNSFLLPGGCSEITTNTGLVVTAFYHGSGNR